MKHKNHRGLAAALTAFPLAILSLAVMALVACEPTVPADAPVNQPGGSPPAAATRIIGHDTARLSVLSRIPESAITKAKDSLRIVYGHTSHGSQIVDGMSGLATFAKAPKGGAIYRWNRNGGGSDEALALHDQGVGGDLGNPDRTTWAARTRTYLQGNPSTNVVMWSWCGQVSVSSSSDIETYLSSMAGLEHEFPSVAFIYMTGHLDGTGPAGNLHLRNEQIRKYCRDNDKWLYDFADIERYDPDGVDYLALMADDGCNYSGGNWATAWQDNNPGDWYQCSSAHSKPLNANIKAYAAWYLFARLAGWNG